VALTLYKKKRDFKQTSEPEGKKKSSRGKLAFVIQRHDATRLHYDFRLEMDGVMKSWAVPKGPSLNPNDKRLAMMVEDHPYDYKNFYGTIPKGNYGAGEVEIWDEGTYTDIHGDDSPQAEKKLLADLEKGEIKFILHGKNLKGEFVLVKIRGGKYGDKGNPWLLIKHRDQYFKPEYDISKVPSLKVNNSNIYDKKKKNYGATAAPKKNATSSASPRGSSGWRRGIQKAEDTTVIKQQSKKNFTQVTGKPRVKLGYYIKPMLAKETDEAFDDEGWVFEVKWDGYRAVSELFSGQVNLYSRNGLSFNDAYPLVVEHLSKMKVDAAFDGEIVALDEHGVPSFQLLQKYGENPNVPLVYYVFDLIRLNKRDITHLTLKERKELLRKLIKKDPVVRYSDHVDGHGIAFFKTAVDRNLEGIIAKKKDSTYHIATRTSDWLKIKNQQTEEAVIVGYTDPRKSRKYFGSLLLAHNVDGELKYIGNVGTGFDDKLLRSLYEEMQPLRVDASPLNERVKTVSPSNWIKPKLVANIRFTEKTKDGILRQPVFLGLRVDKSAKEVREDPGYEVETPVTATTENDSEVKKKSSRKNTSSAVSPPENSMRKRGTRRAKDTARVPIEENKALMKLDVPFTNTTKIYFPKQKITKGDVIQYYFRVAPYILPYLKDRPESMKRTPNGIADKGFYQKDAPANIPKWIKTKPIYSGSNDKNINYIICNDVRTLVYMANMGCIELNPWHSTIQKPDYPDYTIIDIDPSDENTFEQVIDCAQVIKEILDRIKIDCYCKTSGASGLHIYIPLAKRYNYEQATMFAEMIAHITNDQLPETTSLERSLAKRGKDKIYVDYGQNRRGQTIAVAYSMRPVEAASISTPLDWKEVKHGILPSDFTLETIFDRLQKKGDLFKGVMGKGVDILKAIKMLEKISK